MKKVIIDEKFREEFLNANARDNYVFTNCPVEFLRDIKYNYAINDAVKSIFIGISRKQEDKLQNTLAQFTNDMQRYIIASSYLFTRILLETYKGEANYTRGEMSFMRNGLSAINNADYWKVREYSINSPNINDISTALSHLDSPEINIVLIDSKNKYLHHVINNLIFSQARYKVKVFTNNAEFTNEDSAGHTIQDPEDYIKIDAKKYIDLLNEINNNL